MYNRRLTTHGGAAGEHGVSELQNRLSIPSAGAVLSCVLREGQTCLACAIRATSPKHAWSSGTSTSVCPSPVLHHGAQSTPKPSGIQMARGRSPSWKPASDL